MEVQDNIPRSILVLLKIVLENIKLLETGLCQLLSKLEDKDIISLSEKIVIRSYMRSHSHKGKPMITLWWREGRKYPRKRWLKEQIKNLEAKH